MKKVILVLLMACPELSDHGIDDLQIQSAQFDHLWDVYSRKLFGCPPTGETTMETCRPTRGEINYHDYQRVRDAAKKLFDLED